MKENSFFDKEISKWSSFFEKVDVTKFLQEYEGTFQEYTWSDIPNKTLSFIDYQELAEKDTSSDYTFNLVNCHIKEPPVQKTFILHEWTLNDDPEPFYCIIEEKSQWNLYQGLYVIPTTLHLPNVIVEGPEKFIPAGL